jgi:AraC-like DNA-binding protein
MVLHITNMDSVDDPCSVRRELEARGFSLEWYDIGQAKIEGGVSDEALASLTEALAEKGFGVLRNPKELLVEQVKQIIREVILCQKFADMPNIMAALTTRTGYNYRYLSRIFTPIEKSTIEHYVMIAKVERVKTLLTEGAHSVSDIAFELHYSSGAHLSAQFKMITGITIRAFRAVNGKPLHEHAHGRALRRHTVSRRMTGRMIKDTASPEAMAQES